MPHLHGITGYFSEFQEKTGILDTWDAWDTGITEIFAWDNGILEHWWHPGLLKSEVPSKTLEILKSHTKDIEISITCFGSWTIWVTIACIHLKKDVNSAEIRNLQKFVVAWNTLKYEIRKPLGPSTSAQICPSVSCILHEPTLSSLYGLCVQVWDSSLSQCCTLHRYI